jgi:hypothetical protein
MFQPREPVAFCDQFDFFLRCEPECEVLWEPFRVPLHLLIQPLGRNSVDLCEIRVDHYPVPANRQDSAFHSLHRYGHRSVPPEKVFHRRGACAVPPGPEIRKPPGGGLRCVTRTRKQKGRGLWPRPSVTFYEWRTTS